MILTLWTYGCVMKDSRHGCNQNNIGKARSRTITRQGKNNSCEELSSQGSQKLCEFPSREKAIREASDPSICAPELYRGYDSTSGSRDDSRDNHKKTRAIIPSGSMKYTQKMFPLSFFYFPLNKVQNKTLIGPSLCQTRKPSSPNFPMDEQYPRVTVQCHEQQSQVLFRDEQCFFFGLLLLLQFNFLMGLDLFVSSY